MGLLPVYLKSISMIYAHFFLNDAINESLDVDANLGQQDGKCSIVTLVQFPLHFRRIPRSQGGNPYRLSKPHSELITMQFYVLLQRTHKMYNN
jgi:hypothetical protein